MVENQLSSTSPSVWMKRKFKTLRKQMDGINLSIKVGEVKGECGNKIEKMEMEFNEKVDKLINRWASWCTCGELGSCKN